MYQCLYCDYKSIYAYNVRRHTKAKHYNHAGSSSRASINVSDQPQGYNNQDDRDIVDVNQGKRRKRNVQNPKENVKYSDNDTESMDSNDSTESDTETEEDEFIKKFEKCCNQINDLTSTLVGVRMTYIKLLDEIKAMKMNKENKTVMIQCMEKYFIHLHNMKDLYYFHNSQDENDETVADDNESDGSDHRADDGTDGSDNIDSGSVSGDDNNSANEYDESEYGAGETDDASEALSKKSDDDELEGRYTAFHKGFHKFYIKFEDEIKAKGGWVMSKFLTMKKDEGMDMECEDESHKLANDQFVKRFLKRDEKIQRGRGIGGILG